MRGAIAISAAIGIGFFTGTAAAQEGSTFAKQGKFVLSAERLLGLSFTNDTVENAPGDETQTTTTEFAFGTHVYAYSFNPYAQSQWGVDVFVIDHLSVGAGLDYWQGSGKRERTGQPSNDLPDVNAFRLTPRVGYGMMFTDVVGLWARGGLSYFNIHSEQQNGNQDSEHGWAFTAEGLLVISPIDHVGIHLGPVFDFGFAGEAEDDPADPVDPTTTNDVTRNQYGVLAGIMVWF